MYKHLIAAGAMALVSTAAFAQSNSYNAIPLNGYGNQSKIIQDNSIYRYSRYGNYVTYDRRAFGNDAYTAQLGALNTNVTVQSGDANYQYLFQNGYRNANQTWQFGFANSHVGVQDGYRNNAVVAQGGLLNKAKTFQFGANNDARIVQAGRVAHMKPHLRMQLQLRSINTWASFRKAIVKPGTAAVGGGLWAPRH